MIPPNVMTETMPVSTCMVVMEGPAAGAGENICRVIAAASREGTPLVVKVLTMYFAYLIGYLHMCTILTPLSLESGGTRAKQ